MFKPLKAIFGFILGASLMMGVAQAKDLKEWTFLVFLNGHNNLDQFGDMNIKQMQEVGSSDQVNLVVQWASMKNTKTKRLYVEKNSSVVVEELNPVDMGDYKQLIEFIKWGHDHYPAKKYFINVWNHGNGWHRVELKSNTLQPTDISFDDRTGNRITTEQLGLALEEGAKYTGGKIELYGSDACLMSMVEVVAEMSESVKYFVGSQEVEPGEGWPYANFIKRWVASPTMNGAGLGKILTEEYYKAYTGGIYGKKEITFSALDVAKLNLVYDSVAKLTLELKSQSADGLKGLMDSAQKTQSYTLVDYKDLYHFVELVESNKNVRLSSKTLLDVKSAVSSFVIANAVTKSFQKSHGISIWIPTYEWDWQYYGNRYLGLEFHKKTGWGDFANLLVHTKQP